MLSGNEKTLVLFEWMTFVVCDMMTHDFIFSGILMYLVSKVRFLHHLSGQHKSFSILTDCEAYLCSNLQEKLGSKKFD